MIKVDRPAKIDTRAPACAGSVLSSKEFLHLEHRGASKFQERVPKRYASLATNRDTSSSFRWSSSCSQQVRADSGRQFCECPSQEVMAGGTSSSTSPIRLFSRGQMQCCSHKFSICVLDDPGAKKRDSGVAGRVGGANSATGALQILVTVVV